MVFYGSNSITLLQDKLDYERWFLNYISSINNFDYNKGTFYFKNEDRASIRDVLVKDDIFNGVLRALINEMSPLTFVACFKILDMIFEWILEEHEQNNVISKAESTSFNRISQIKSLNGSNNLTLPQIMQNNIYIFEYSFALYENLRLYRNEVVHDNKFSTLGEKLQISITPRGVPSQIEIDNLQMGAFIRTVTDLTELLLNNISSLNLEDEKILKYSLDKIVNLHNMSLFNQGEPVLFRVIVNTTESEGKFSLNLEFVREELKKVFPDRALLLDLYIVGVRDGEITNVWHFPVDEIPNDSILIFDSSNYTDKAIPKEELESNANMDRVNSLI